MNQAPASTSAAKPAAAPIATPSSQAIMGATDEPAAIFAKAHGKATKIVDQDYSSLSLRTVKTGSEVPFCFSEYSKFKAQHPDICKACPVKLDCMQVEE